MLTNRNLDSLFDFGQQQHIFYSLDLVFAFQSLSHFVTASSKSFNRGQCCKALSKSTGNGWLKLKIKPSALVLIKTHITCCPFELMSASFFWRKNQQIKTTKTTHIYVYKAIDIAIHAFTSFEFGNKTKCYCTVVYVCIYIYIFIYKNNRITFFRVWVYVFLLSF